MTSTIVRPVNTPTSLADANEAPARPTILILLGSYLPGYKAGGPIRSVENLVAALGREFCYRIVTLDRDFGDKLPFPGISINQWVRVGQADVMYLQPGLRGFFGLFSLLRSVDRNTGLYLNSFFARWFSMLAVFMRWFNLCQPRFLVLAPRGEFSLGALRFKRIRKRIYIRISQWLGLYYGLTWHASSDFEAADILRQFPLTTKVTVAGVISGLDVSKRKDQSSHVAIASDLRGLTGPVASERRPKMPGELRVVFVSRVSRKKNLAGALRMLAGVSGVVVFDIYGPAEDGKYWKECQNEISALPLNIQVRYCGQIEHTKINQVFREHDLFLFPTFGENYGHVICEALAAGCPVLISDQTPWRNLEAQGVGWDIPLDEVDRFQSVLQQCVDGDDQWHAALSTRAMNYGVNQASDREAIDANRRLFKGSFA